jgi:L-alanine-DL-glutamate epimerase-like enolase superfamily enzyme
MVDAGRAWDAETALSRVERFAKHDVFWLEEPLHPFDIEGYRELSEQSSIPIAGGEAMTLSVEYADLLRKGKIHFVQPDLGRVGGITGGAEIDVIAKETGARTVPHAFGTGILLAASAQWAAAMDDPLTEYTRAPSPLAQKLVKHEMKFQDGSLSLTEEPGLGVDLDEDVVAEFRVK